MLGSWRHSGAVLLSGMVAVAYAEPVRASASGSERAVAARKQLAVGDTAWQRRADGFAGGLAAAGPIDAAVSAYEQAVRLDPESLEGYWKLERALWFKGEYATSDARARRDIYDKGRKLAEKSLDLLASRVGGRARLNAMSPQAIGRKLHGTPWAAHLFLGAAAHWGLWAHASGPLVAVRHGALAKVRDYTLTSLALEPQLHGGAAYRVIGRLHTRTPRLPLVSGWINREQGLKALRRALEIDPREPTNRFFLAEALLSERSTHREGVELLRGLTGLAPRPDWVVEDTSVRAQSEALLAEARKSAAR